MREPTRNPGTPTSRSQQALIIALFDAAERSTNSLARLVPDLDRDRTKYAVASVLLEEAWVSSR